MKKTIKTIFIFLILLIIVAWVYAKLLDNQEKVQSGIYIPEKDPLVYVSVQKVAHQLFVTDINYLGTLHPIKESTLHSQFASRVRSVFFKDGDFVRSGKTLVQLDDDLLQSQFVASLSAFKNDSTIYARYLSAFNSAPGSVSKHQLEQLATKMQSSRSAYESITKQIDLAKLKAPFSGYITNRSVEEGSLLLPSMPYARLSAISKLKFVAMVSAKDVLLLKVGKKVSIEVGEVGLKWQGKISFLSPQADQAHKYAVHVMVDNRATTLRAGMNARMKVQATSSGHQKSLSIPRSALLGSALQPEVYVVKDGRAHIQQITLGRTSDDRIEVLKGLKENEEVVVSGQINLTNGMRVSTNANQD